MKITVEKNSDELTCVNEMKIGDIAQIKFAQNTSWNGHFIMKTEHCPKGHAVILTTPSEYPILGKSSNFLGCQIKIIPKGTVLKVEI